MTNIPADILSRAHELEAASPQSMVAIFTPDGDYLYVSESHRPIMGYSPAELASKNLIRDVIAPEDIEHTRLAFMDAVLRGRSILVGVNLKHKSGDTFHVRAESWYLTDPATEQAYLIGQATPSEPASK